MARARAKSHTRKWRRCRPTQSGRPVGLAVAKDGALLLGDDINGVIYRVSYAGGDAAKTSLAAPPRREPTWEARPKGAALALARSETASKGTLKVTSAAIPDSRSMPLRFSAYGEDISPAIGWTGLPTGATHLALLMEDPDAQQGNPFVHWVAWNILVGEGALPEGLPQDLQLADPKGMRQGRNTRGSIGYFGPRPPVGDNPHRYHFQVFALSAPLQLTVGANREELLAALTGKVLARGEFVGTYAQPAPPTKR